MYGRRLAAFLIAALLGFAGTVLLGQEVANAAGAADEACLGCHSADGIEKKLANGETLSLQVDGGAFSKSVHSMLGCAVCHPNQTLENHPPLKTKVTSIRENSLALGKVCRSCHADKYKLYEGSIHAALLRDGNPIAPACNDCHNPHAVMAKAGFEVATGTPCSKCHSSIYDAYAGSVHGQARKAGNTAAPVCSSCHSAHDVKAAAGEDKLKDNCLACHPGAAFAHQSWLPNARLHMQTISCPACHAPGVKRRVDLRLYDATAQTRMAEKQGVPIFEMRARAIDTESKGLNSGDVQRLLKEFDSDSMQGKAVLRGRLEVDGEVETHQLADKSKAVSQCESCHRAGSQPFQKVTVSIASPDGRPLRYEARQEVLNSVVSIDSAGGFYVIGGTRIKLLDWFVVLALLVGIGVPIVHFSVKMLVPKFAKRIGGREDS